MQHRRQELGLSREQLAERCRFQPSYVRYVETAPVLPSWPILDALAAGLSTTVDELLGAGRDRPPGNSLHEAPSSLWRLDPGECSELVAPGGVGRIVYSFGDRVVALPLNFTVVDGDILVRTGIGTDAAAAAAGPGLAFQVDRIDPLRHEGWSVLVQGRARIVTDPAELEAVEPVAPVPWAEGEHLALIRITPREWTGRRLYAPA